MGRKNLDFDLWTCAEKVTIASEGCDKGPGLVRTGAGELLAFYIPQTGHEQGRAGRDERMHLPPGRLLMLRSGDGGTSWSSPIELPTPAGKYVHCSDPTPALRLSNGRIVIIARAYDPDAKDSQSIYCSDHFAYSSDDDGHTWHMGPTIDRSAFSRQTGCASGPLVEIGGVAVFGCQGILDPARSEEYPYSAALYRSSDEGITWEGPTAIAHPDHHCILAAEPAVLGLPDGRWIAFVRYHEPGNPRITNMTRHESHDEGATWSAPEYVGLGAQAHALNLPGGGIILTCTTWNGIEARNSYDDGWTFTRTLLLYDPWTEGAMPGNNGGFWNHSLLLIDDDTFLAGWTGVAEDDPHKTVAYGARDPRWGFAARARYIRRQRDVRRGVPLRVAG